MKASRKLVYLTPLCALLAAGSADATNGYFPHGDGIKAKGMGGASVAMTDDAHAGYTNPAAAVWEGGDRAEVGLDLFSPKRSMSRSGSAAGLDASVDSGNNLFLVPDFGYNHKFSDKLAAGVTVYGNGGMNTDYPSGQINCGYGPANVLCGSGNLGMDFMQLIIAPVIAYKINESNSIGLAPLFVFQQFKAYGLQAFSPMSSDPSKLTGGNYDQSRGIGVRLGYLGKVGDKFNIGAAYSPKISMSKFGDYAGLFADGGNFDIPANYALGVSFKATPEVTLAFDYSRINYSGVTSVGNPSTNQAPLGAANGPGFGWTDVNVWKFGIQWQAAPAWVLRAGFNVGDNPVQSRDVSFNILAPGVITHHYTMGGTYALSPKTDITFAYMYAPSNSVTGASLFNSPNVIPPGGMGGNETIKMSEQSLGIEFGWRW